MQRYSIRKKDGMAIATGIWCAACGSERRVIQQTVA
jgi:hypothetical protein